MLIHNAATSASSDASQHSQLSLQELQQSLATLVQYRAPEPIKDGQHSTMRSPTSASAKLSTLTTTTSQQPSQLSEILNSILPPRTYTDPQTGLLVRQQVSTVASSRDDVISLQLALDTQLQQRQARPHGICPVRQQLYSQCLDELLRQVTIESPERGLLLRRVRDESNMSLAAYRTLYQTATLFGLRKQLDAEGASLSSGTQNMTADELHAKCSGLEAEKRRLQYACHDARNLLDSLERKHAETRQQTEKRYAEEKDFLRFQAQHLEAFLKQTVQ